MTVPASPRRTPSFAGDGVQTVFPFEFVAYDKNDVRVVVLDEITQTESEPTVDTDFTVDLNPDQDSDPGGDVVFGVAPTVDQRLTVLGGSLYSQETALPDGGAYRAENVERALDRLAFQTQQLAEAVARCAQVPVNGGDAAQLNESINVLSANLAALLVIVNNIDSVVQVAGDLTAITNILAIEAQLLVVAANIDAIVAVADLDISPYMAILLGAPDADSALGYLGAQAALVSGTSIKTINGESLLGSGNITVAAGSSNSTGLYSARPSAATAGAGWIYYATDTQETYRSNGSTWVVVGGRSELGYAELTSSFSTSSTTFVDVTGMTFTAVAGERPLILEFNGHVNNAGGSARAVIFGLYANGALIQGEKVFWMVGTTNYATAYARARIAAGVLTPGTTYTFKLTMRTDANTGTLYADSAWQPFLRLEAA